LEFGQLSGENRSSGVLFARNESGLDDLLATASFKVVSVSFVPMTIENNFILKNDEVDDDQINPKIQ
jgi:hypothetical protein